WCGGWRRDQTTRSLPRSTRRTICRIDGWPAGDVTWPTIMTGHRLSGTRPMASVYVGATRQPGRPAPVRPGGPLRGGREAHADSTRLWTVGTAIDAEAAPDRGGPPTTARIDTQERGDLPRLTCEGPQRWIGLFPW